MKLKHLLAVALYFCGLPLPTLTAAVENAETAEEYVKRFNASVKPLLKRFCFECHGADTQEGELRIDQLDGDLVEGTSGGKWREVLDALNRGDMPPDEAEQPTEAQRNQIIDWLTVALDHSARLRRSTGGHVVLRRLTRSEYNNTMRDLLGVDIDYVRDLPPDSRGIDGYKNNGQFQTMSEQQLEEYYKAAQRGLSAAIVRGEKPEEIHHTATQPTKGVRFDKLGTATFDKDLGGTIVGAPRIDPRAKKTPNRINCFVHLVREKLPDLGTFRVRIKAAASDGDASFSPPRMHVAIGHKTGVAIEPQRTLGEVDVTAKLGEPQTFEFTGRFEEFPLHKGPLTKKFPGLRVLITDRHAVLPKPAPKRKKGQPEVQPELQISRPELVVYSVEFDSPVDPAWPPLTHTRLLPPRETGVDDEVYLQKVFENFISRAFRRPAESSEVEWAIRYFDEMQTSTETFEDAAQEVFSLILVSPKFLYLPEYRPGQPSDDKAIPLTEHELATRLSFLLWGTLPDEELRVLADNGTLTNGKVLAAQVERLLNDGRSWQFVERFAGQWLSLDNVDAVAVNPEFFPSFDNSLKADMKQEAVHFFGTVLREKLSCLNFIESDFVMVNDRLAGFYGIEKPRSGGFQKVSLPEDSVRRGGVLTQASFLLGNSTGAESHPVYRARWFLDRVMGEPPRDPPADVPELDSESDKLKKLSLKEQLEVHRTRAACNRCHRRLDPWGIPFESFNGIGQYVGGGANARNSRSKKPIDDRTTLPDGTDVKGSRELISYLAQNRRDEFGEAFCRHLLTYALGRSLEWTDQPLVDQLSSEFKSGGYRMDRLLVDIVQSDAFRMK